MASLLRAFVLVLFLTAPGLAVADSAPFDLAGPTLDVTVTHAGATLPISETPNLSVGDQLSIKADLPAGESVHYLLVAAFLRGATNPPPQDWFYRSETWTHKGRDGLRITVPAGAQQVLVFLAPQTGGDFRTLVGAVRGRPGAFVRASQDLDQATLDRSRLDTFLASIHRLAQTDPERLKDVSPLLARSLAIKLDPGCLQKTPELQAACLMQGQDSLVLNDGHSTSIVEALTSGSSADLAAELSSTPQAGFGYYSPYVAAVIDIARIMDSFHTAQYQYIPALAVVDGAQISLVLNTPPSFHNPMSVLVAALPAVEPPQAPPLRPVDPKETYCAEKPDLLLPVVGAPLVFSTDYAHAMVLRTKGAAGEPVDLPVKADAEKGGFVADTSHLPPAGLGATVDGALHGEWGFEAFDGPQFQLQTTGAGRWRLAAEDEQAAIVGRDDTVHLRGRAAACVDAVMLRQGSDKPEAVEWKAVGSDELAVAAPLKAAQPGAMTLLVKSYGDDEAEAVPLQAFAQPGRLDGFALHAGDASGVLKGARLDEVAGLTLRGIAFQPGALDSSGGADMLSLTATDPAAAGKLKAGETATAKIALKDGRTASLKVRIAPPRPSVTLIGRSVRPDASGAPSVIQLPDDDAPLGATLSFSVRAQPPTTFSGHDKIEVASADGGVFTTLTPADGLILEDSKVALATLDTRKAFGGSASAFGPLRFRLVDDQGAGDWQPLVTLVRLPVLDDLKCPAAPGRACKLSGFDLFLIDAVSRRPGFEHPTTVPEGFPGYVLSVPHPVQGRLYLKLHDDPSAVVLASFPAADPPASGAAPVDAEEPPASPTSAVARPSVNSTAEQKTVPPASEADSP